MIEKEIQKFNCYENFDRLDVCVSSLLGISRSHAQTLIKDGLVKVNEKIGKPSMKALLGDHIEVTEAELQVLSAQPENIEIDIVYQDKDLAVINKAKGMVVHPAVGNVSGTLVNALMYHIKDLSGINSVIRPGIVHRLDKDTSGLLVVAKNDNSHINLAEQIKRRTATRIYYALVLGNIKEDEGEVVAPIGRHPKDRKKMAVVEGGRNAHTKFSVVERYGDATLLRLKLVTGRTHQIRVHMAYIGHGVLGDETYGPSKPVVPIKGQALHAGQLSFDHPTTLERMQFSVDPPNDFLHLQQWFIKRKGLR